MKIEYKRLEELKPYEQNPRNNQDAVDKVKSSIERFGFNVPMIIEADGTIVAGHTRYEASKALGLKKVPCVTVDGLTEEQVRQLRIADNKTAELSAWDYGKLLEELEGIIEIDMSVFGFFENAEEEEEKGTREQIISSGEYDLDAFRDEAFKHECPFCGFRWNL